MKTLAPREEAPAPAVPPREPQPASTARPAPAPDAAPFPRPVGGDAEKVIRELERRGELWRPCAGVVGLRGDSLALFRRIEARVATAVRAWAQDEWLVPPAVSLETLSQADYFASFPQWLTVASHLSPEPSALEAVATAQDAPNAARAALAPAAAALPPALCYHTYAALAGRTLATRCLMTAQGTCWRNEGERTAPLERGWAFTMREVVCLGTEAEVHALRTRGIRIAATLAREMGLPATLAEATDPFFAPGAGGRKLLQRLKALKHELLLPVGGGRSVAAASFNHHQRFFGEAFGIRLPDGRPASSGCVAFGLERWLLAWLVAHGTDSRGWPALGSQDVLAPVHLMMGAAEVP